MVNVCVCVCMLNVCVFVCECVCVCVCVCVKDPLLIPFNFRGSVLRECRGLPVRIRNHQGANNYGFRRIR